MLDDFGQKEKPAGGLRARTVVFISALLFLVRGLPCCLHELSVAFRRSVFHTQGLAQQEKQLRVVVHFFVVLHLLRGKVSKIVAGQPADEKCAVDNVIVAQHTVQRQVFCNA